MWASALRLVSQITFPAPSVARQSSATLKSLGGQIQELRDEEPVVMVGMKMQAMCLEAMGSARTAETCQEPSPVGPTPL